MATPTTAVTRWDYGLSFDEFDLEMNKRGFIGPQVLRPRVVKQQAASLGIVPIEQLLRQRETRRAARSGYGRDSWEFEPFAFATEEFGWESVIDDRERKIYRDLIDQEATSAARAVHIVCEEYERDVAAAIFNETTWTGSALLTTVGVPWSTWATATPIADVNAAITKVRAGGFRANALIVSDPVFRDLINCTQTVDRVRYAREASADVMRAALASLLNLDRIIVGGGITNSAVAPGVSIGDIWGRYAMVAQVGVGDDPREACLGRTWMFEGENAPNAAGTDDAIGVIVEQYREESSRGDVFRARNDRQISVMYAAAGHLLKSV